MAHFEATPVRTFSIGPAVVPENVPKLASALSDGCGLSDFGEREGERSARSVLPGAEQQLEAVMEGYFVSRAALQELVRGEARNDLVRYCAATGVQEMISSRLQAVSL